jgi:hypothetical protein
MIVVAFTGVVSLHKWFTDFGFHGRPILVYSCLCLKYEVGDSMDDGQV